MHLKSSTKSWLILLFLTVAFMFVGFLTGGRQGILWGFSLALCVNFYIYFYIDESIPAILKSRIVEGQDPWSLTSMTAEMAALARIPTPKIHIVASSSIQALVTGRSHSHGHILFTEGILNTLSKSELSGVIAYQIASLKQMDTLSFLVSYSLTSFLIQITQLLDSIFRAITGTRSDTNSFQSRLFTTLAAPLISWILKLSLNDKVYFDIDALAATYLKKPRVLAEALWKLEAYSQTRPLITRVALGNMFIVSPLSKKGWPRHFSIQPSTDRRIKRLIGYYPI